MSQSAPSAGPPPPGRKPAPSRLWYVLAFLVFVGGFGGMALFLVDRLGGIGNGLVQIVVPGEKEIVLEPGFYTIFHERESVVDGRIYQSNGIAGLEVSLTGPAGEPVAVTTASMSANYNIPGHRGVSAFQFEAKAAGTYRLSAGYADGTAGPETVLAVGKGFVRKLIGTIFGGLALAFGGAGLAVAIAVPVFVKRLRAKRAAARAPT
jgi:hypothetical protein